MRCFEWLSGELEELHDSYLLRRLATIDSCPSPRVSIEGEQKLLLCSNNYLGLAADPRVIRAAMVATEKYGAGAGAARLISGNMPVHTVLEEAIARFKGTEAALLFSTGYMANTGLLGTLCKKGDVIFCDRLSHASIIDGCTLSSARMVRYRHNDMAHLEFLLQKTSGNRKWIVTEGVFSMDGDMAPLPELLGLAGRYDAVVILDEAHATGVLGQGGRGTVEYFGCRSDRIIFMGTLGKALGGFGAYVAGERVVIDYLLNKARSFIFTTALPPAVAASAMEALHIVESEPGRVERLRKNAVTLRQGLQKMGFDVPPGETPIIPVLIGDAEKALALSKALFLEGVYAMAVRPPTVPKGESRIRVTVMATHTDEDIRFALEAFERAGRKVGLP
ncbi:MAG: 8-amino-7-oxononanoate synthase [Nitrospirota bacterium]|nr:8-amino-7-oxononanoate synthase [Nitrospirota bacterium]